MKAVRRLVTSLLAILAVVALTGSVSPAVAQPTPVPVSCNIKINHPHNSTHVPGQVNIVGTATCTIEMSAIYLSIQLYRDGGVMAYNYNYQVPGGTYAMVQANTACVPGVYHGTMDFWLTWPPTATRSTDSGRVTSSSVAITC